MDCSELVPIIGWRILLLLLAFGVGGVGLHCWYSYKLTFFKFAQHDRTHKCNLKRLLVPLSIVSGLSFFTPIAVVLLSPGLRNCLEDQDLPNLLNRLWSYILPMQGTWISIAQSAIVCAFIGAFVYGVIGLMVYFGAIIRGGN